MLDRQKIGLFIFHELIWPIEVNEFLSNFYRHLLTDGK
jgi:hypothetical protein